MGDFEWDSEVLVRVRGLKGFECPGGMYRYNLISYFPIVRFLVGNMGQMSRFEIYHLFLTIYGQS